MSYFFLIPLLIILLLVSGLVFLNTRIVPKFLTSMSRRIEERTGLILAAESVVYVPFSGLQFSRIALSPAAPDSDGSFLTIRRMRIDLDIIKYLVRGADAEGLVKSAEIQDVNLLLSHKLFSALQTSRVQDSLSESGTPSRDVKADVPESETPASISREDSNSGNPPGQRTPLGFIRFWDIASRVAGNRLFPDQVSLSNAIVRYSDTNTEFDLFKGLNARILRESSPLLLSIEAADSRTQIEAQLNLDERQGEGNISAAGINPGRVISYFVSCDLFSGVSGLVDVNAEFVSPVPGLVELQGRLQGRDLSISHRALGEDAVSGIDLKYDFNLVFDSEAPLSLPRILGKATPSNPAIIAAMQVSHLQDPASAWGDVRVREGRLNINGIVMDFLPAVRGIFPNPAVPARLDLRLHVPETEADAILRAIPKGLSGPFGGMELSGRLSWDLDLEIPLDMIREMNWRSSLSMDDFSVVSIPAELNVYKLKRSFIHTLKTGGRSRSLMVPAPRQVGLTWMLDNSELSGRQISLLRNREKQGAAEPEVSHAQDISPVQSDGSYGYVYLEDMSRWIPLAILTCEDGDFFFHDGINWLTFRHAVERNIRSGGIEVGASTLTMQLIKNLFLKPDRVLVRKLHEAFLVYLLEGDARVPKERILELYINLVEFGPDIIGIHAAAEYYFGKTPDKITAAEAVWLASILPSPRSYSQMSLNGEIPDTWWAHMKVYFDLMLERGRFTEEEYRKALSERPRFKNAEIQ